MRSYDDGKYAILKDGNFQLAMSRILASDFKEITVAVPKDSSDLKEFKARLKQLNQQIDFVQLEYGKNAVETRESFYRDNEKFFYSEEVLDFDLIITDITGYSGTMSYDLPFINNFNITKLPTLDRPYIDKFFEKDIESIKDSLFTTVINQCQKDYIVSLYPELDEKVVVLPMVAHESMLPGKVSASFPASETIFFPFRISDKAYRAHDLFDMFIEKKLYEKFNFIVTDPNDTFNEKKYGQYIKKIKPSKDEYYEMLASRPIVLMLDNIDTVLHPGTIEFFYYGCPVITFENELIKHANMVKSFDEIHDVLYSISYEPYAGIDKFVYAKDKICSFYNEQRISNLV